MQQTLNLNLYMSMIFFFKFLEVKLYIKGNNMFFITNVPPEKLYYFIILSAYIKMFSLLYPRDFKIFLKYHAYLFIICSYEF